MLSYAVRETFSLRSQAHALLRVQTKMTLLRECPIELSPGDSTDWPRLHRSRQPHYRTIKIPKQATGGQIAFTV
ncbi:hypothetical protein RRG08_004145 [Elysia crispata]|uniref:Uncharacterized protein n=1 Tax=Elysia crispata TaxID=231223 RepID=A0AAE1D5P7_9GAST|nr:hypothetical protein RRG08_004145 [Elysia crispata]